jgi:oxygen-independent coproporphyrinogen-3 oxidase
LFGAYVHIPFCARVCPYCDFAVVEGSDDLIDQYIGALLTEIASEPPGDPIDAVFVGGGTPSHVSPYHLGSILQALHERFGLSDVAEVTLEANPEDWTEERATGLGEAGFNRVSFGVQSFDAEVLSYLGRRHTPHDASVAVEIARSVGFRSVSVDLIMGSPGESGSSWRTTVDAAASLPIDHVSAYGLTVERGTPLGRAVEAGADAPDPDDQADKYEYAQRVLPRAGLEQYEVSNYAKPGHECAYNLTAWAQGEYLAFGMGAHGHRAGTRAWRVRNLTTYIERLAAGNSPVQGSERLETDARERERLILGLRRTAGVVAGSIGQSWIESAEGKRFVAAGVVDLHGDRLVVRRPLLTDAVARSLVAPDS